MGIDTGIPTYLYYSKKAEKLFGSTVGSVPDETGGRKEVIYTCATTDPGSYGVDDKVLVWKGKEAELQFISRRAPANTSPGFRR
jgi:hypothetical protein